MQRYVLRYIIVFLTSFGMVLPFTFFEVPAHVAGTFMFTLFTSLVAMAALISVTSMRRIRQALGGNMKEILDRVYVSTFIIILLIITRIVWDFGRGGIIPWSDTYLEMLFGAQFALVVAYFYTKYDIVAHLRAQPKVYDSSKRSARLEEDVD